MYISTSEVIRTLQEYEKNHGVGMISGFGLAHNEGMNSTIIHIRDKHYHETFSDDLRIEIPHTNGKDFFTKESYNDYTK